MMELQGEERARAVAAQWQTFRADFFLRVAARAGDEKDDAKKQALADLSTDVMRILDALVMSADKRMDGSAQVLQKILARGADENGEFALPLEDDKAAAMLTAMDKELPVGADEDATEGVLGHAYGYMKKASDDNLEGMVVLIQGVLQMWAAREVRAASGDSSPVLARVAQAKPEEWNSMVGEAERGDFETQLKSAMEAAVLERPNGSFAQRVLAEFLKEMETITFNTEE